jgi:hypothetical protein
MACLDGLPGTRKRVLIEGLTAGVTSIYNFRRLDRNALLMTGTELELIAATANMGEPCVAWPRDIG